MSEARSSRTRLTLAGDATLATAISRINRFWVSGLSAAGYGVTAEDPSSAGDGGATNGALADVLIHHDYRQHFARCAVGNARRRIAVRTWDFGPFPRAWAARIGRDFDQLWVHTSWVREKAIEGGVAPESVAIVPNGFDPAVFTPDGPEAGSDGRFTFLFVGAAVVRKGLDILLRAYGEAFSASDDVRLIVKGHSGDAFYGGQHLTDAIASFAGDPGRPALRYIDDYLPDRDLAALYRGADVGVFPYRAEGFAMPILEAMACALPCVVPHFGACLDFCSPENSFFVEPRRIRLPVRRELAFNAFEFREQIEAVDFAEIPVANLATALRAAYECDGDERQRRGTAAAHLCHTRWRWTDALSCITGILSADGFPP